VTPKLAVSAACSGVIRDHGTPFQPSLPALMPSHSNAAGQGSNVGFWLDATVSGSGLA
jgi:hypothetical protein